MERGGWFQVEQQWLEHVCIRTCVHVFIFHTDALSPKQKLTEVMAFHVQWIK